jgi:repressor LexA
MSLSERQEKILQFIDVYFQEHNYPPTIREIGKAVGISSTSVVKYNLERLQEKDKLTRSKEVSRGLRLLKGNGKPGDSAGSLSGGSWSRVIPVPKLGDIAAGAPIAAAGQQENPYAGETLTLTADLVPDRDGLYALRVKGESMIDALVYDGDWVIIQHQSTAERGEMIVAWIKDKEETTLKYYYPEGATVRLQPANQAYQPIIVRADQLEVQGKVLAVVRQLG